MIYNNMEYRIKELCKERDMNLSDLADIIGMKSANLSASLGNNGNPTIGTLQKIAKALNVEIWELFTPSLSKQELTALIDFRGDLYRANSIDEIENIVKRIKMIKGGDE